MRKKLLAAGMAVGLFVLSAGTASAGGWDLIHSRSGYDRVTLRAWTRNYNQVAFVADHAGTRVDVAVVINCRNGYHFENTWSDGGGRFRFVTRGLENNGRCNHVFRVDGRSSVPILNLAVYGRG